MGVGYPLGRAGDWIDISITDMQNRHTLQIVEWLEEQGMSTFTCIWGFARPLV